MVFEKLSIRNMYVLRLNPGDDILASLEETAKKNNIKNAVILCGIGSAISYHYHVVGNKELPPRNDFVRGEAPSDIIGITGVILEGRIHAHIAHSDTEKSYGGHLEPGVKVLTLSVITIAEVDNDFTGFDTPGNVEDYRKK